jgi:dihydroorotase
MNEVVILRSGRILDPSQNLDTVGDLVIADGKIAAPDPERDRRAKIVDVAGCLVLPGLIDMHVHLREPGEEYKETIATGTRAAAAGGFTAVACMPNTRPVNDNGSVTSFILEQAVGCMARVYPAGAISLGSKGERLAEYGEMKEAGAVALTDDGLPVISSQLMRRAMEYARSHGMVIISHAEEPTLSKGGCMHEGEISTRLGLGGIPAAAEAIMVHREIALAELTGARVHIAHVSTGQATELIRRAKAQGLAVTAETAPHYFTLTDASVAGYDTNAKMNPPLRTESDRQAIRAGLADGTFDAIATDHAPHSILEKELEFNRAANGIVGLETSLPLSLALVREGVIDLARLVHLLSCGPAAILGVAGGSLQQGTVADVTVVDPEKRYTFTREMSFSKSSNSPFWGREMQGRAVLTLVGGKICHNELAA